MNFLQIGLISFVGFVHLYIVYLEMVLWTTKKGISTFGLKSKEFAEETKVMAANQGLYNGFLVAGLIWSLLSDQQEVAIFFLSCVFIAGIYGAFSTKKIRIFYLQSVPAFLGLLALLFN